ncbi:MAG TPA: hypothetical protein VGL81_01280 [Polyangiaceae bacterium]|jgi:hypothetical protein
MRRLSLSLAMAAAPVVALALQGGCSSSHDIPLPGEDAGAKSEGSVPSNEAGSDGSGGSFGDTTLESGVETGAGDDASDASPHEAAAEAGAETGSADAPEGDAPPPSTDAGSTAGEVWVLRVGASGASSAPTTLATAVFLDRFLVAGGTPHGTIALPVAANGADQPLTLSGSADSEGALNRTGDGKYVLLAGYAAAPGAGDTHADGAVTGIADTATSGTAGVPRVVGRVDASGAVDTSFTTTAYSTNDIRGAASTDASVYWMFGDGSGSSGGISYQAASAGAAILVSTGAGTVRIGSVFGGRVYGSSATGTIRGVFTMTDALPTVAEPAAVLPGFPTTTGPSPYAFAALALGGSAALDTIYLCDDRASASGGGLQRWKLAAGTWTLAATLNDSMTSGCRGVAATATLTGVTLLVTTSETTGNHLLELVDTTAGLATITATDLADAPPNTVFRGVALAPN